MHFCDKCGNMYYLGLVEGKSLEYHCKKCGNVDSNIGDSSVIVSKTNIKKKSQQFQHMINKYTKFDPTLPRVNNIECPNNECISNISDFEGSEEETEGSGRNKPEKEIIYIRYDNENMKYIYLCALCDKVWVLDN